MTEQDVFDLVSDSLGLPRGQIDRDSVSADFPEWDSMGTLAVLAALDAHDVHVQPENIEQLQSIQGILEEVYKAESLE